MARLRDAGTRCNDASGRSHFLPNSWVDALPRCLMFNDGASRLGRVRVAATKGSIAPAA